MTDRLRRSPFMRSLFWQILAVPIFLLVGISLRMILLLIILGVALDLRDFYKERRGYLS